MHLGQFLRQLTRLAEEFGIAVVITNQVCLLACMYVHVCMSVCTVHVLRRPIIMFNARSIVYTVHKCYIQLYS